MKYDVLFLSWRRYKYIIKNIDTLAKDGKCKNIYISNDGYKGSNNIEKKQVLKAKSKFLNLIKKYPNINFYFNFIDRNKGCKEAILDGIDWFFQNSEKGLIIEDDILINKNCFKYIRFYQKFFEDKNCFSLGLYAPRPLINIRDKDCFIYKTPIFYCWGWFTTKDKWLAYRQYKFSIINSLKNFSKCYYYYPERLVNYFIENTLLTNLNFKNTWDYLIQEYMINTKKYSITPSKNFVKNLGFADEIAAHGSQEKSTNPTPNKINKEISLKNKSRFIYYSELKYLTDKLYKDHSKIRIIKVLIYELVKKIFKFLQK